MKSSIEIRPLSKAETDNVSGGGYIEPRTRFDHQVSSPAETQGELTARLSEIFSDRNGPKPPVVFG